MLFDASSLKMPEDSSKVSVVRCPKCGRLLPELPSYSVYCCGGCGSFLQAQKKSSVSDHLSDNSRREVNHGGFIGVDDDSERIPIRVSKSPLRNRFGDTTRKSLVRETNLDGLNGSTNSSMPGTVLDGSDILSKSFVTSSNGDGRKSRSGDQDYRYGKSPDDQTWAYRPSVLPRMRRTWHTDDPITEQADRRANRSGEYGNLYGRRRVEVPYDDWVDQGDHRVARRNRDLRSLDERIRYYGLHGDGKVIGGHQRGPVHFYSGSSNYRAGLLRKYNELHEKLIRVGDLISFSQNGQGDQGIIPNDYVYEEFSRVRNETVRSSDPNRKQFGTRQSMYSTYERRKETFHHDACACSGCYTKNFRADLTAPNPTPCNLSSHQRSSVDSKSDGSSSSSAHDQQKRILVINQNGQLCYPIARGAPFVICYNCFHLLRLPEKLVTTKKNQFRLYCGSCRTILSIDINIKRSDASDKTNFDANASNFRYTDSEPSSEATKKSGFSASSSQTSKDDHVSEIAACQTDDVSNPPGSPFRDHVDCILAKESDGDGSHTTNKYKGSAQISGEISNTDTFNGTGSADTFNGTGSADTSITKDQGTSPDSHHSLNTSLTKAYIFVNGNPITPSAVRSAEKMAGTILPGDYWYDSRAGFWGVMGDLCLGIIPPCIREFSSQMQQNCSGGNTCVYVNGRELHESDLDLLSSRGLPRTRHKYYVIDISGIVQDEDTGGFVVDLGKLAPTVEITGCGFGMQPLETYND